MPRNRTLHGSTARAIARAEADLELIHGATARQLRLLQLICELTGSNFAASNLFTADWNIIGGAIWPFPPERQKIVAETGPILGALLAAGEMRDLIWGHGSGKAFVIPEPMLLNSEAYRLVYSRAGIRHLAWYLYPAMEDGRFVIVGFSEEKRPIQRAAVRALQRVCDHFACEFVDVADGGVRFAKISSIQDHVAVVDDQFRAARVPAAMHAMLTFFFGPMRHTPDERVQLPQGFVDEFEIHRAGHLDAVMRLQDAVFFGFTRRRQGRVLMSLVEATPSGGWRICCHEDVAQQRWLTALREACGKLKRDRYSIYSACLAMIDGARGEREVLERAGLGALSATSGRRIVSMARGVLDRI